MKPHRVGRGPQGEYVLTERQLAKQTLLLGRGNAGKTNAMKGAILALQQTASPLLVLDAGGTLFSDLAATNAAYLFELEVKAERDPYAAMKFDRARERTKYLAIDAVNSSGLAFDITKLRTTVDALTGETRPETVAERVAEIVGIMSHQRGKDAEQFNIVARTAPAAFAALVAAGRNVRDLFPLLDPMNVSLHETVAQAINRSHHLNEPIVRQAYHYFRDIGRSTHRWDENVDSTKRMFGFLNDAASYFDHDSFDYHAFHDAGGRLFVNFVHADPRQAALMRRFLFGMFFSASHRRQPGPDLVPSYLFNDEVQGVDPETLLAHMARSRNKAAFVWLAMQSSAQFGEHFSTLLGSVERVVLFRPTSRRDAEEFVYALSDASVDRLYLPTLSYSGAQTRGETETDSWQDTATEQRTDTWREANEPESRDAERHIETTEYDDSGTLVTTTKRVHTVEILPPVRDEDLNGGASARSLSSSTGGSTAVQRNRSRGWNVGLERVGVAEQMQLELQWLMHLPKHYAWFLTADEPPTLVKLFPHRSDSENAVRVFLARREFMRQRSMQQRPQIQEAYQFAFPDFTKKPDKPAPAPAPPPPPKPASPRPRRRKEGPTPIWARRPARRRSA